MRGGRLGCVHGAGGLGQRADTSTVREAIQDAREYRSLGLPVVDSTGRTPEEVASDLVRFVRF
jgi:hypothetical protein